MTVIVSSRTWETTCSWHTETQVRDSHHVVSGGRFVIRFRRAITGSAAGSVDTPVVTDPAAWSGQLPSRLGAGRGRVHLSPPHTAAEAVRESEAADS